MKKVYCAGPLFHKWEQHEMSEISRVLEEKSYSTFLPHRDGLEFALLRPIMENLGAEISTADNILQRAIFCLDIYQLICRADAVVANLNGRVPDEGTVVEASLAWLSSKALVLYKTDSRTILSGTDHPMLMGLGNFHTVDNVEDIPKAIENQLRSMSKVKLKLNKEIEDVLSAGKHIQILREENNDPKILAEKLLQISTEIIKTTTNSSSNGSTYGGNHNVDTAPNVIQFA